MKLDELRSQVAVIDREILERVAERMRVVSEEGRLKRDAGVTPRDYSHERVVLQQARASAEELGLSPNLAEALQLQLIRSALTVQEQEQVVAHGRGSGQRVLVIGGNGKMGRWAVRFLDSQGFDVEIADPSGAMEGFKHFSDWARSDLDQDLIVVAAPLGASNQILHALAKRRPTGTVFDIGSLKSPLRSGLQALKAAKVDVASVHPMFGPDTELLSGSHVILVDLGVPAATDRARALFEPTMATMVQMDLESHDRLIAYVLGLSHALNIAFFTALGESGETAPKLAQLSSTTFDAQLSVAAKVASENPDLYFEIQSLNDYGTESLGALLYAVERLRSVVRAGDHDGFVALMEKGREYLRGYGATNI